MPAVSQKQRSLIFGKRNQYKTEEKTPKKWKWIWEEEWENKGKLPKYKINKNENKLINFSDYIYEKKTKKLKVFLGGTCNGSDWRDKIIDKLKIDYFNPVVDDWTEDDYEEELRQRKICDYLLYVITPKMKGVYSIAEVIDDSNKNPEKTIFCFIEDDGNNKFDKDQIKSLNAVGKMIINNKGKYFKTLNEVIQFLNNKKYIKENIDHSDIDPWGEEDWEADELSPVLQKAREQGKPFDQITILNCSHMNLKNLDGIEQLVNLEILDCSNNQLTSLREIENLRNLERLDCSNNQLTSLRGIENLRNLEILWCSNNQLTSLEGIENLRNLEILWCSNNQLTSLREIENLRNLKVLWCYYNQFTKEYKEYLRKWCKEKNIKLFI
jgi:hypothetical protein